MNHVGDRWSFVGVDFSRSREELDFLLLYCLLSRRTRDQQAIADARRLFHLASPDRPGENAFADLHRSAKAGALDGILASIPLSSGLPTSFRELAQIDPLTCSTSRLAEVHGLGPKTSRLFAILSRPHSRMMPIDACQLQYLSHLGFQVPLQIERRDDYDDAESLALGIADEAGLAPWEYCISVWAMISGRMPKLDPAELSRRWAVGIPHEVSHMVRVA